MDFGREVVGESVETDMIKNNDMMSVKDVQEMLGVPLLGAIPEDTEVIVSTNRGEPLVLKKKLTLAGSRTKTRGGSSGSKIFCRFGATEERGVSKHQGFHRRRLR